MEWEDRIELNPNVLVGKPVVKGTRLSVELIVGLLGDGWSMQDVMESYDLTIEDIRACLRYASRALSSENVFPLRA